MVLFNALCLFWVFLAAFLYRVRNYPGLFFILLVGAYELPGPALFYWNLEIPAIEAAQFIYGEVANATTVFSHVLTLMFFLFSFTLGSIFDHLSGRRRTQAAFEQRLRHAKPGYPKPSLGADLKTLGVCLAITVFAFGIASVTQGEGWKRLDDYLGGDYEGLRVFSYGIGLLPVVACLALVFHIRKSNSMTALLVFAALPLLYEVFLTSRRQFFLPVLIVIFMWQLYSPRKRISWLSLASMAGLVLVFFGFQYSLRERIMGDDTVISSSLLEGVLAPQAGEFVSVGATSLYSYPLVESRGLTHGSQFVVTLANSVPFVKLGNRLFPSTARRFTDIASTVAPFGGLSMIAECYLSFGRTGVIVLGLLMAILAGRFHRTFISLFSKYRFSATNVLLTSYGAVLLGKYRSGMSDAFLTFTSMSILFFTIYLVALFMNGAVLFRSHNTREGTSSS
jgi:oligosaccharide repeat unit polymerase